MDYPPFSSAAKPFTIAWPSEHSAPVVFASAHSGRDYREDFVASARIDLPTLRRSEDCFVDELFSAAPAHGAPLIAATFPRVYCDPNREAWELDAGMFADKLPPWVNTASARAEAGLGTIPRIVATGEAIYRDKLPFEAARERVDSLWQPFHDALRSLIDLTRGRFGRCLLVDCHSMPAIGVAPYAGTDIVLGDAHGTSCAGATMRRIEQALSRMGYRVRRNTPYAGGYITRHYGRPREGVEAVQIEVCRSLYMDEARFTRSDSFAAVRQDITALIAAITAA